MQPLLKPTKVRTRIFLASAEIVSILNIKLLSTLAEIVSIISFILIPEPKNFFAALSAAIPKRGENIFREIKEMFVFRSLQVPSWN